MYFECYNVPNIYSINMETSTTCPPPRQYAYFNRSFGVELALNVVLVPLLAALWAVVIYYFYYTERISAPLSRAAVYFTITYIFAHIFYKNYRMISASKSVAVEEGRIVKKGTAGIIALNSAGVINVMPPIFPRLKRWMIFKTQQNKTFRVSVCIHGGDEMVESVFFELERQGVNFPHFAEVKRQFCGCAKGFAARYRLRERYLSKMFFAAVTAALLSSITVMAYWERGLFTAMLLGYWNMLLQTAAYLWAEKFYVKKNLKNMDRADNTDNSFAEYYLIFALSALILGMMFGILITEPV